MTQHQTDIGELIRIFFDQFMAIYDDEDIASVATAAAINELLTAPTGPPDSAAAA
jgi:hypothetical protein